VIPLIGWLAAHPTEPTVICPTRGKLSGRGGTNRATLAGQAAMHGSKVGQATMSGLLVSTLSLARLFRIGSNVFARNSASVLAIGLVPSFPGSNLPVPVFVIIDFPIVGVVPRKSLSPRFRPAAKPLPATDGVYTDRLMWTPWPEHARADDARLARHFLTSTRSDGLVLLRPAVIRTDFGMAMWRIE
jgi:hypothetical protein